jgi:transposase
LPGRGQQAELTCLHRHPDGKAQAESIGCLRTHTGAQQFCAIRSYLSTAGKHGISFFDALVMLTEGRPWMPAPA